MPVKSVEVSSPDASHSPYEMVNNIIDDHASGLTYVRLEVREFEASAVKFDNVLPSWRRGVLVRCRGVLDGCGGLPL